MSTSFEIQSSTGSYPVSIQSGSLESLLRENRSGIVVADERFASMLAASGVAAVTLPSSELTKSLDAIPEIVITLRGRGANRETQLIAVGGGVVQDIVGFIASIYMRGVSWTYVPTTLLAMSDSCVGGKSSINVGPYKNLIGTFHPPASIVIDPTLVASLSAEQRVSGLIEACKICYCRGTETFRKYLEQRPSIALQVEQVEQIVVLSLLSKKWFIEQDEFDRGERLLLNFGHTFGHALESASHFRISHGVGVGVGMLCAIQMGRLMGRQYSNAPGVCAMEDHVRTLLAEVPGLKEELASLSVEDVVQRFQADKKHRTEYFFVILVAESGQVELAKLPRDAHQLHLVENAVRDIIDTMGS